MGASACTSMQVSMLFSEMRMLDARGQLIRCKLVAVSVSQSVGRSDCLVLTAPLMHLK